jgi:zinc protease
MRSLQAMERRNDRVQGVLRREFSRLMYGGHFSTRQSTKASVEAVTREGMLAFHQRYYHPRPSSLPSRAILIPRKYWTV